MDEQKVFKEGSAEGRRKRAMKEELHMPAEPINAQKSSENSTSSHPPPPPDSPPPAYRRCMPVPRENMSKPVFELISGYTAWKNENQSVLAELAEFASFSASLERGQSISYMDIEYEVDAILCLNVASNKILDDLQQLPTTSREDQQHRKKEYEEIASILASHEKIQAVILALWKIDLFFESHKAVTDKEILDDANAMHDQYIGDMVRRYCQYRSTVRSVLNKLALAFHTMQQGGRRPE